MADTYVVGQVVPLTFECFDSTGALAAPDTATLTITLPSGSTSTPTLDNPDPGVYVYDFTPTLAGRHVAAFVATGDAGGAAVDVFDVVSPTASVVTLAEAKDYLGDTSADDDTIQAALDAERQAQSDHCDVDDYTPALREALFRRVARNLAARAVPIATWTSFDGAPADTRVPTNDPEVVRLEGPYRRWTIA